jgi:hypothetical protein
MKMLPEDEYRAYLLRLWRVQDDVEKWRAQLEEVGTGERHGFGSMEELIAFLEQLGKEQLTTGKEEGGMK